MDFDLIWERVLNLTRGLVIGIVCGIVITLFAGTVSLAHQLNLSYPFLVLLCPLAALITQWFYQRFGTGYKETTSEAIEKINEIEVEAIDDNLATSQIPKAIRNTIFPINFITAFLTHVTGASGGKEGAGVQIGICASAMLYRIEKKFKNSKPLLYKYLMCGASAAFGALFGAPIAGIFFGTQFASPNTSRLDSYLSNTAASFAAVYISRKLNIHVLHFDRVETLPLTVSNFFLAIVFAIVMGLVSILATDAMHKAKELFHGKAKSPYTAVLVPSLLLMLCNLGIYLYFRTDIYQGMGNELFARIMAGDADWQSFFIKFVLILLTYAASFTGGEVVPLLLLGATFGSGFAMLFNLAIPTFATLGAVALLSGGTNLPLVCFALGFELFSYNEPSLLFVVVAVSFVFSGVNGIYKNQRRPY